MLGEFMQIPQSSQAAQVIVTETASRTLPLTPGQVAQAVVVSAGKAGENVDIQLAGKIVTIQAGVDLQRGQTIELQRSDSADKVAFKLISVAAVSSVSTDLRPGQTLLAEVIKLLPQQSILLALQQTGKVSVPLELDISRLSSSFRPGQQLLVQILSNSPLSVALQTPNQTSSETMVSQQRRLMPMVLAQPPQLQNVINALPELKNMLPVQNAVSQLWQNIRELQTVQQPANLQQAIQQSGVFLERQLLQPNPSLTGDFKANLLKLAAALEGQIRQTANGQINAQNLPPEIRTALINLLNQPAALQQLPSHITNALLAGGQTPAQLLTTLLARQGSVGATVTNNQPMNSQNAPVHQINQNAQFQAGVTELARLQVLLREVETALARVQMNQLNMVREADSPTQQQVWLMDVPLRDKQQLQWMQLQFQQGNKQNQQDEEQWQVTLNLETQNLGKLRASIGLQSSVVSVALTAEDPKAVALLEENIDLLREKLAALDLQVQQLSCHCAPVEWLTPLTQTATSDALLDISV
jgi:Flagellar hook-length control protein FliK